MQYICEECWSEQDEPGWCEKCYNESHGNKLNEVIISDIQNNRDLQLQAWTEKNIPKGISIDEFDGIIGDDAIQLPPIQLDDITDAQGLSDEEFAEWSSHWTEKYKDDPDFKTVKHGEDALAKEDDGNYDYGEYGDWSDYGNYATYPVKDEKPTSIIRYGNSRSYRSSYSKPSYPPKRVKAWTAHNYWFIGDVHCNIDEYLKAIKDIRDIDPTAITIQVGDIGLNTIDLPQLGENDFFIQGNHDDIKKCMKHPNFLGKYGYKNGVFYMGGAKSNGLGFKGEELTTKELAAAIKLYKEVKPEIVVTHDCPESLRSGFGGYGKPKDSPTTLALDEMWQAHAPNIWAFGHMHIGYKDNIEGTDFICVAPLEAHQIRLGWVSGVKERHQGSKPMEMTKGQAIDAAVRNIFS